MKFYALSFRNDTYTSEQTPERKGEGLEVYFLKPSDGKGEM